jgi:hypothetical protein
MDSKTNKLRLFGRVVALLFVITPLLFPSCGIYSFSGANTEGLNSVSIQYFQNRASLVQPELSQTITEALIKKCQAQTNLKVIVNDVGDANFEGDITEYKTVTQTISGDARAAVNRFTIEVKVRYTNSFDPKSSFEKSFSRYEDYDSNLNLSQVEGTLVVKIVEMLVEDIFNAAFVNW